MSFSTSEKRVIKAMHQLSRWATAHDIAKSANMSWNTAKGCLLSLHERGIANQMEKEGKVYWMLNE